jgi:hypothetical protein
VAAGLLFDENVPAALPAQLLRHKPDIRVRKIGDLGVPEKGTTDQDILRWCEEHDYVLVTFNRKSMPTHLADHLFGWTACAGCSPPAGHHDNGTTAGRVVGPGSQIESIDLRDSIRFLPPRE